LNKASGKGAELGAVLLHVREPGAAEIAQRQRHALDLQQCISLGFETVKRRGPVVID
jgi:hypothetical protein